MYRRGRGSGGRWSTGSCRTDPVVFPSGRRTTRRGRPCTCLHPRSLQIQPGFFLPPFLYFLVFTTSFARGLYYDYDFRLLRRRVTDTVQTQLRGSRFSLVRTEAEVMNVQFHGGFWA